MIADVVIAQISDMHIKPEGRLAYGRVDTAAYLARAVTHILELPFRPNAVIATGDLVDAGRPDEYRRLRGLLAPLPMPIYLVPGNHDDRAALVAEFSEHHYLPRSGPLHYTIEDFPLRLVVVDTLVTGEAGGAVTSDGLAWLDRELARYPTRPTMLVMHHPPFRTGIKGMDSQGLADPAALGAVVRRHPHIERIVCGHVHRPIQTRWNGTTVMTSPATAHQVALELRPDIAVSFIMEPPACLLHCWRQDLGLITHTSYIGHFDGPHPFFADGRLID